MSSASRFLLFGNSLFLRTTNNGHPHKTLSPFLSLKPFPSLQFQLYCSSSAATTAAPATSDNDITETLNSLQQERKQKQHPWPEWVTFVDQLKTRGYFMQTSGDDDITSEIGYTDMNQLKNACISFARDRYDVFKLLSIPDIETVVGSGCPSLFRKAVNSAKRMRVYVQKDEGDACGACTKRGSCDRAYVILKGNEAEGRTVDIVRVLMFYALDPLVVSGGEKSPGSELIEASARKLLSELIELSETPLDPARPKQTPNASHKKERDVDFMDGQLFENVKMKKGDWICTKCNFMNFANNKRCRKCGEQSARKDGKNDMEARKGDWICSECEFLNFSRNIKCLNCKADGPERVSVDDVEMKKGDWNCTNCGFMNFASNKTCLRCQGLRPERKTGEWNCPSCEFLNFSKNKVCLKCNCERPERTNGEWHCPSCDFLNFGRNKVCLKCNCECPKRTNGDWHCPSCDFLNFSRNKVCLKCNCKCPEEARTEYQEHIWKRPY